MRISVCTRTTSGGDRTGGAGRRAARTVLATAAVVAGLVVTTVGGSGPVRWSVAATPPDRAQSGTAAVQQIVPTPDGHGYWMTTTAGGVLPFGDAANYGSAASMPLGARIVGMASTVNGHGYWEVGADGGIFAFGDAAYFGSTGAIHLNRPIVGMAPTADGGGYWLVASDGGIFAFGDAAFYGSTGSLSLNQPIVGMAATADGRGYWLVASDGGIFAFGDATFHGSTGSLHLNRPVVGVAVTPGGAGYWLVASDGGIFAFGDATFHGSMGGAPLNAPVTGMAPTADGGGYWMVGADGGLFAFGDAPFYGSLVAAAPAGGTSPPTSPVADPPASIPPTPDFLNVCYPATTSATCTGEIVQATTAARAQEGLGPMRLPVDYAVLTPAEQLFVLTDVERVDRGLPPFVALDPTLSADAAAGAVADTDPAPVVAPPGMTIVAWGANWGENGNPLGADYFWMYDDGPGSGNLDCTAADTAGCWGHRQNILGLTADQQQYGGVLLMGAAEDGGPSHGGWVSDAEVTVLATGPVPAPAYTWAQAVAEGAA